jgi:polyisoprenoid-binding protein YceI
LTRRRVLALLAVVVLAGVGAVVWWTLSGDSPPPPALDPAPTGTTVPDTGRGLYAIDQVDSFVGYRVREEYVSFGVRDAVGRTSAVDGGLRVDGRRVSDADLTADLGTLRSDKSQRDAALHTRALESDRFPKAHFVLTGPFALSRAGAVARGRLTLHGQTAPVSAQVRGQRLSRRTIELVGSTPIRFADFGIDPPSVAGLVTVRDHGALEFRLRLRRSP